MHCSKNFRSFVLVGFVVLVTAFYQSTQPSALTIATGLTPMLTPRQRVKLGPRFL